MSGTNLCEPNEVGPDEARTAGAPAPASNSYDAVPYSRQRGERWGHFEIS